MAYKLFLEIKLPSYNTRINLPTTTTKINTFKGLYNKLPKKIIRVWYPRWCNSGEEDTLAPTEADLKRRAQQLIDAKMKKGQNRPPRKKWFIF